MPCGPFAPVPWLLISGTRGQFAMDLNVDESLDFMIRIFIDGLQP